MNGLLFISRLRKHIEQMKNYKSTLFDDDVYFMPCRYAIPYNMTYAGLDMVKTQNTIISFIFSWPIDNQWITQFSSHFRLLMKPLTTIYQSNKIVLSKIWEPFGKMHLKTI